MKQYTDKQLLQMTKTELVKLYRELEQEKSNTSIDIEEAIKLLRGNGYLVKERINYGF